MRQMRRGGLRRSGGAAFLAEAAAAFNVVTPALGCVNNRDGLKAWPNTAKLTKRMAATHFMATSERFRNGKDNLYERWEGLPMLTQDSKDRMKMSFNFERTRRTRVGQMNKLGKMEGMTRRYVSFSSM